MYLFVKKLQIPKDFSGRFQAEKEGV